MDYNKFSDDELARAIELMVAPDELHVASDYDSDSRGGRIHSAGGRRTVGVG